MFYNGLISWDVFNANFSGKQEYAFEQLSYLLFCHQYDQPTGIFRYFNQAGLETCPVQNGSDIIGFQSKFYSGSVSMSSKETELKKCITTIKTKYPNITKLQFFISKEFSESREKDKVKPKYQLNLDEHATSLGMEIIWCMRSYFEETLTNKDLLYIKDIFFNPNQGISNYINQVNYSSGIIFQQIKSDLKYKKSVKKILRDFSFIDSFLNSSKNYLIISGDGGSGKSALIKDWYLNHRDEFPCFVFRATDFQVTNLAEFSRKFGDYTLNDFLTSFRDDKQKVVIIDSAEKLFLLDNQEAFKDALTILLNAKWKIVFTIRTSYSNLLINTFLFTCEIEEYNVEDLSTDKLKEVLTELKLVIPTNELLIDLLCNLFYLHIYLQCVEQQDPVNETISSFKTRIWDFVIKDITNVNKNLDVRRENTIIKIVSQYISNGLFYTPSDSNDDSEAIGALRSNGIIVYDSNLGYTLSHDIYEEWVLEHIIESALNKAPNPLGFFINIGNSLVMRKAFRKWLSEQTKVNHQRTNEFIIQALTEQNLDQIWVDEILISIMNGEIEDILNTQSSLFDGNNYSLLIKMSALLNTACQSINMDFVGKVFTPQEILEYNIYKYTKPSGKAWYTVFEYINNKKAEIQWNKENIAIVIYSLSNWVRNNETGRTTRFAGEVALYIYDIIISSYRFSDENLENTVSVILDSAQEIKNELEIIFQEVIDKKEKKHNTKYYAICNHLLSSALDCSACCMVMPDYMTRLAWLFWVKDEMQHDIFNYDIHRVEKAFGVNENFGCYPTSAHQTFIFQLLRNHPNKAIGFIIEFFNYVTKCYKNFEFSNECCFMTLHLPSGENIQQIASQRLWLMHRGTTVAPDLLECILMALERWLLFVVNKYDESISKTLCLDLMEKSKSAALTSVVVSAVIAHPENLFDIACILLQTGEIFQLDISRVTAEYGANFLRVGFPKNELLDRERINTNNQEFRKKRFEDIIINYQMPNNISDEMFQKRIDCLHNIFDAAFEQVDKDDTYRQMSLYRMDLRKYTAKEEVFKDGNSYVTLSSDFPDKLNKTSDNALTIANETNKHNVFSLWAHACYNKEVDLEKKYPQYENDPTKILDDLKLVLNDLRKGGQYGYLTEKAPVYAVAILMRDFRNKINSEEVNYCERLALDFLTTYLEKNVFYQCGSGIEAAISTLPYILKDDHFNQKVNIENPAVIYLFFLLHNGDENRMAVSCFSNIIWNIDSAIAKKLFSAVVLLKDQYNSEVLCYHGISKKDFLKRHKKEIKEILISNHDICLLDYSTISYDSLLIISSMIECGYETGNSNLSQIHLIIWEQIFKNNRDNQSIDYNTEDMYLKWLAIHLLLLDKNTIPAFVNSLTPYFSTSRNTKQLLTNLICKEDVHNHYTEFWVIWNSLFLQIETLCEKSKAAYLDIENNYYTGDLDEVVITYALAFNYLGNKLKSWHSLRADNTEFYQQLSLKLGYVPVVLYSIAKVLNTIGYDFLDEGIEWIYNIVNLNNHLQQRELFTNTLYYMEEYMQRYLHVYKDELRKSPDKRNKVIRILDFLVSKGSVCGFMLREEIA